MNGDLYYHTVEVFVVFLVSLGLRSRLQACLGKQTTCVLSVPDPAKHRIYTWNTDILAQGLIIVVLHFEQQPKILGFI
jgi:hypothetical protein